MSKKITIDEFLERNKDIICGNYVAMNKDGEWVLYGSEPEYRDGWDIWLAHSNTIFHNFLDAFNIAPYQGDWKESLRRVK